MRRRTRSPASPRACARRARGSARPIAPSSGSTARTTCAAGTPTRDRLGTASVSSCSCLVTSSSYCEANPVALPPGRARLRTNPSATGSTRTTKTIGIVRVARCAAMIAGVPETTMTSTLARTRSAARSCSRSVRPSAHRNSMVIVWPSIQPRSRSPRRSASTCGADVAALPLPRKPIRAGFAGCACERRRDHRRARRQRRTFADRSRLITFRRAIVEP